MKKETTAEIINRLNCIMDRVCKHLANEEYEEANKLQDEFYELEYEYNLFDRTFEENGKTGIKDVTGKILVPAIYTGYPELYSYSIKRGAPIPAQNDEGKFALVTSDGKGIPITEFKYDMILCTHYTNFYTCYRNIGGIIHKGLLNRKGEEVLHCEMDKIFEAMNGIIVFEKEGKKGIITTWGLYVPPIYNEINQDEDSLVYVLLDKQWGYISDQGIFIPESDKETFFSTPCLSYLDVI